mmetsp:Transcript_29138/g.45031  ORF Transcript_29138/g.45031 Transcript_29138/m.45031 type:complete len:193 (-) Transcript_29138:39-617(-)
MRKQALDLFLCMLTTTTASPRLTCLFCSALPFFFLFLQHKHLHLKEAVAATAAESEKSPSAKSFSLRGAVAVASVEDAADEDEELIQYGWYRNRDWSTNPYTGKRWGSEWQNGDNGENPRTGTAYGADIMAQQCYNMNYYACRALTSSCKWLGNSCAPKNFEDEEFDSQDLEMFDASEGDEVYSDYDEVDED